MTAPTQKQRVLRALQRAGRRGVTAVDFSAPYVCDGGDPILRLSARLDELRRDGHQIEAGGRRNKCVIHKLVTAPVERSVEPLEPVPSTVGVAPPRSPFDPWDGER